MRGEAFVFKLRVVGLSLHQFLLPGKHTSQPPLSQAGAIGSDVVNSMCKEPSFPRKIQEEWLGTLCITWSRAEMSEQTLDLGH